MIGFYIVVTRRTVSFYNNSFDSAVKVLSMDSSSVTLNSLLGFIMG